MYTDGYWLLIEVHAESALSWHGRRRRTRTGYDVIGDHVTTGVFSRPSSGDVVGDVVVSAFVVRRSQMVGDTSPVQHSSQRRLMHAQSHNCNCNCNCIVPPPTRRPRAHHRLIDWRPTKYIIGHIGDGFLWVKWPNQQCQSTKGRTRLN